MKIQLTNAFLFFFLSISSSLTAQQSQVLPKVNPEEAGMSSNRLAYLDSIAIVAIKDQQVPGLVALVARNGKIVYHKAFGTANAKGELLDFNSIFRIASQTKAITSTAVMMLWERGEFQLDDPISKYIPEFENEQVLDSLLPDGTYTTKPATRPITIRHLLTHTSGLGYGEIDGDPRFKQIYSDAGVTDLFTTEGIQIEESVKKLAKLPLHHNPGEKFTYSEGLDVLGYFVEIISGKPLDKFFKTEIFEPLKMQNTYFYLPKEKRDQLVSVQTKNEGNWVDFPTTFYDPDYPKKGKMTFFSGGAGLSSTPVDYAQFLQMYLNKGTLNGHRLLSRTTVDFILSNQIGDIWKGNGSYHGLAFSVVDDLGAAKGGKGSPRTFEWGGYFNTQYFADPEENLIGIIMKQTQKVSGDETSWKFRNIVFSSIDD
ncbi:CubicO group peptidase (beta-lactamase class C family) [Leeuwenhoekiella aestuarii]|uniref:CubicO group peptidase (Beta-lactamase class C family) n=1 Tax=Leeuwenhoekiella aestuarii TaxID=2249426 RepID=A0A4Q0NRA7_9FLAO|nr:serine hydrolase domain-containing protein [Leeuwenhoekiella aestuarii]RXG12265.1 CubicO group peptidase (beta-lactamase class C family) [Leeuwenhoekiella aestuarii]RXG13698.1 CubicO group peptidase (beta-lactamase class C family) [Leeuwenhoekiella aestuarii]